MTIKILVQKMSPRDTGKFLDVYRNTLVYDDNVNVPFNRLYDGLRLLYPQKDIVIMFSLLL